MKSLSLVLMELNMLAGTRNRVNSRPIRPKVRRVLINQKVREMKEVHDMRYDINVHQSY